MIHYKLNFTKENLSRRCKAWNYSVDVAVRRPRDSGTGSAVIDTKNIFQRQTATVALTMSYKTLNCFCTDHAVHDLCELSQRVSSLKIQWVYEYLRKMVTRSTWRRCRRRWRLQTCSAVCMTKSYRRPAHDQKMNCSRDSAAGLSRSATPHRGHDPSRRLFGTRSRGSPEHRTLHQRHLVPLALNACSPQEQHRHVHSGLHLSSGLEYWFTAGHASLVPAGLLAPALSVSCLRLNRTCPGHPGSASSAVRVPKAPSFQARSSQAGTFTSPSWLQLASFRLPY